MGFKKVEIYVFTCNACSHEWQKRSHLDKSMPSACPKCKTRKWDDEYVKPSQRGVDFKLTGVEIKEPVKPEVHVEDIDMDNWVDDDGWVDDTEYIDHDEYDKLSGYINEDGKF